MRAVLLAGGRASRLGGLDKTGLPVGGRTLLEHALAATEGVERVLVGPSSPVSGVPTTLEEPRYGGPVAALAAGLAALPPQPDGTVVVLAADQPRVGEALALVLAAAHGGTADGWVAVDGEGRRQPLLALYREDALRAAVASLEGGVQGASLRQLLALLPTVAEVPLPTELCADVDTPEDAARAGIPGFGRLSSEPRTERTPS
jgi:molybdopterin-guanine dinucleotide biosynthesis protein A